MKKLLGVVGFLCVFLLLYSYANSALHIKTEDGIEPMRNYYALPENTVDVLMVGSSHMGRNISPKLLWQNEGIAGYNLWSGMQPIWNSYYFVKEGLKTQKPKVVVIDIFLCGVTAEYSDSAAALKNVQAVNASLDQVNAARASFRTWQEAAEALWGMPTYHNRYNELTENDFYYYTDGISTDVQDILSVPSNNFQASLLDYASITDELPLTEKSETYLRKTINLCKSQGIPLLLIVAPYQATAEECMRLNTAERIAREEGVDFVNYLKEYQAAGIDPLSDFYDIGHLNNNGIPKLTAHLGAYLKAHYELPDRRRDAAHIWYNQNVTVATQNTPSYALERQFQGDGITRSVDTGIRPLENRYGSWTLLARLDMKTYGDNEVYFSCFSEQADAGNYGLLARKSGDHVIDLKLGANISTTFIAENDTVDLAIVKNSQTYDLYVDGICIFLGRELPCNPYEGNLLIGCQELSPDGEKFRYSRTRTLNFEFYEDQIFSAEQIAAWSPDELPETPLPLGFFGDEQQEIYTLREQFVGGGWEYLQESFIDTGVQLYDESANRFTIIARILPNTLGSDNVYFSCFSEEPDHYRGLLVRQTQENRIDLLLGSNYSVQVPCVPGQSMLLVIEKDVSVYTVYADGVKVIDGIDTLCDPYEGNLLIGCQEDADGEKFRFSQTCVMGLQVLSGVVEDEQAAQLTLEDAPMPEKRVGSTVQYEMSDPYLGDTVGRYLDTGVKLYDVSDKAWTLIVELNADSINRSDAYFSCFSERVGQYRGLLLRSNTDNSFTLFLGVETVTIPADQERQKMRFVIVKDGAHYRVYLNGKAIATLESECAPYDGTLLIGCQETAEGEKFRFSPVKIDAFSVQDGALEPEKAQKESEIREQNQRF
ncbi:MAG: hypothetical protein PHI98_09795 [Eubacteriales bacterium]|nr:hypothetical protein [Eubacteriales bacterium]